MHDSPHPAPKADHNYVPLVAALAGGGILLYVASRAGSPTVLGGVSAQDIVSQNTALNADAVQTKLGLAATATSYAEAVAQATDAVRIAKIQGADQTQLAQVVNAGNLAIQRAQNAGAVALGRQAESLGKYQAKQGVLAAKAAGYYATRQNYQNQVTQRTVAQTQASAAESIANTQAAAATAAANAALAQTKAQQPQWWQYLLGGIGGIANIFGGLFGGGTPAPAGGIPTGLTIP